MKALQLTILITLLTILTACGGGSGGSSASNNTQTPVSTSPAPTPPVDNTPIETTPELVAVTTLPHIEIYNAVSEIPDEPKITANMRVTDYVIGEFPIVDYEGFIGVEKRGSSSQFFYDKNNYGIETRTSEGEDLDASILGFPEEEDWVLHGPFGDKSLIRNALMFDIGAAFERYSSRWKFVEVSREGNYEGLYVLLENIKRDKNRVDISKLKEEDIIGEELTGGYIIKLDKTNGEHEIDPGLWNVFTSNMSFISEHGSGVNDSEHHFIYNYPKSSKITPEQKNYIQNYVHDFEDALAGENFKDEVLGYRNYIDVDSFVDYFIATEISGNVDGYRLSTYLVKDKNAKLAMGPLWDYNLAFGNANYCNFSSTDMWIYRSEERDECSGGVFGIPFWWYKLLEDDYFTDKLKLRWNTLRNSALTDEMLLTNIDTKAQYLISTGAVERNFNQWDILGTWIWPNNFVGATYQEEVDYLKDWLTNRLSWLDTEIENL